MKTINVQIKVGDEDEPHMAAIYEVVRQHARPLMSDLCLVCQTRRPSIAIMSVDYFAGTEEIMLEDPDGVSGS